MIRRFIDRTVEAAIARRFTNPTGANVTPINQSVIDQMYASLAPQDKTKGMFMPGAPLRPNVGITPDQGPRGWQYPVGYNIGQLPRSTEQTSFSTLRNLSSLYDGIGMCERVWFDLCSKPELEIQPRPELKQDDKGDPIPPDKILSTYGDRMAKWRAFFAKPDKQRSLKKWMRMALKDMLEIDALATFKHKDRSGGLFALELIDGSTIKPLLDERGMMPQLPYPAYQQFVYGIPGMLITPDQLIYSRETERTDSPYGTSRVERIILRVNQALRKQNKDLTFFTDGNTPVGFLEPPDDESDWTPEQLLMYQQMFDGLLSGNDAIKARIKVIPPGTKFNKTDPDDIMVAFDQFLLNVTVGAFGLTMAELAFTETVNKSSGDSQEAIIYRRAMSPIMDMFGEMFTDVMVDEGESDLIATWKAFEEPEDFKTKVDAWNILTVNGTQSTSQAAYALGLKPLIETEPFVMSKDGPIFLKDAMDEQLRQAQQAAKIKGLQFSIDNPGGVQQQDEQTSQQASQGTQGSMAGKSGQSNGTGSAAKGGGGKSPQNDSGDATAQTKRSADVLVPDELSAIERERRAEFRRWRECAIKDVKAGKPYREFVTDKIPLEQQQYIRDLLTRVNTVEGIRATFPYFEPEVKRDDSDIPPTWVTTDWQSSDKDVQQALKRAKDAGYTHADWKATGDACAACLQNKDAKVKIGETFPSGAYYTPNHNHCNCEIVLSKEDES